MNAITVAPASPLVMIGKRLRVMNAEMERMENLGLLHSAAYQQIDDEYERLVVKAMGMEPVTLRDALVLALCVAKDVGYLTDFDVPMKDATPFHERIQFANSSILLALMKAGIHADDIGPHDAEYEVARHRREPGTYCTATDTSAASADAKLIAACTEYLRIQRKFQDAFDALNGADMPNNSPAYAILDPQRALIEKIIGLRAVTPEGFMLRARCAAISYLPTHAACQDDPDEGDCDRFMAAILRDAVRLNGEAVA